MEPDADYIPKDLFLLIDKYLKTKSFQSAFDPFMGNVNLLWSLANSGTIRKGTGVIINPRHYESVSLMVKASKKEITLLLGDSLEVLPQVEKGFDAIVSFPPMGLRLDRQRLAKYGIENIQDDYSNVVIYKSLEKLNDIGECIFVVPDSFFLKPDGVRKLLREQGYFINSVIKLYPSLLRPYTSVIPSIVVISKQDTNGVFIAKYNPDYDKDSFVKNWVNRATSSNPELGTIVNENELTTVDAWLNQLKVNQELGKYPYAHAQLQELISEANLGSHTKDIESFEDKPNSVFIPLLGTSSVVSKISDLKIKPQNYIQLVLDDTKIISEYLAGFLNSKVGIKLLGSAKSGAFIEKISKKNLEQLSIPLPPLDTQLGLVKLNNQIAQLSAIANNLNLQLWDKPTALTAIQKELSLINKGDDIEYLIKKLPFPVASILMKYHREDNPHKKIEYLNYFFEALAELLATILISSFYNEKSGLELLHKILSTDKDKDAIKRTTFGGWVNIATRFAKKYRELLSSPEEGNKEYALGLLKTSNSSLADALLSKDLYVVLDEVSKKRNDWLGHSAPVNDTEAQNRCDLLKYNLDRIYDQLLELFGGYLLVKPRNEMTFEDGIFTAKVDIITGSDTNFERTSVSVIKPLDKGLLHFYEEGNNQALALLPFVKLRPSPKSELNSCYFYNRTEKTGGYRWLSYHFDRESEIIEEDDALEKVLEEIT